jgi:hypothetical protein
MVAEVLSSNGTPAEPVTEVKFPNPLLILRFDVIYGIYLQTCSRYIVAAKLLGKKTIVHFVGSDAYRVKQERSLLKQCYWRTVLRFTDAVLYVSSHLEPMVGRAGFILPFPIQLPEFTRPDLKEISPGRDILYYCPGGQVNERIYRLDWIIDYAGSHPDTTITVIGSIAHPAQHKVDLANVEVIPFVERERMPLLYRRHRKLIRMTTEDGLPRMIHEALLCGLEVEFNGEIVKDIPPERDPTQFAKSFNNVLSAISAT